MNLRQERPHPPRGQVRQQLSLVGEAPPAQQEGSGCERSRSREPEEEERPGEQERARYSQGAAGSRRPWTSKDSALHFEGMTTRSEFAQLQIEGFAFAPDWLVRQDAISHL